MKFNPILLPLFTIVFAGCSISPGDKPELLAEVGSTSLTRAEARENIPEHIFDQDSTVAYVNYVQDWVQRRIILEEAERLNFSSRQDIQKKIQRLQEEFILQEVQNYIISEFEDEMEISDFEARNYYQQNREKFVLDEQYIRYRHLIAESNTDAENAKRELMQGVSWEEVARKYSKYADLKIRESERFWPISIAAGEHETLNRYLSIIGPSEISPTYISGNEFHFVQLLDEKPEGDHPELDWLIDQIKEWLTLEKRKRAFNTYVKNLYLQAQANNEIKIYNAPNNLDSANENAVSSN